MRTRASKLSRALAVAVVGLLVSACASHPQSDGVLRAPTSDERGAVDEDRRQPDGVLLDPGPLSPAPVARGDAQGIVALREPAGEDAVLELIEAFLEGWQRESLDALLSLTAPDAGLLDGPDHGHAALVESWRQRLRAHDYGRLEGADLVRPERIERWEYDELGSSRGPARPTAMRPGEVLLHAPLEITRVGGERVFGDVVVMILRRQSGHLRIAAYEETDGP
jgi:hypothetical protein